MSPIGHMLGNLQPGTTEFDTQFKQIASTYPDALADSMFGARVKSAFLPAVDVASSLGFDVNDLGIQSALFSVSTNHGGYRIIIRDAADIFGGDMTGVSEANQIDAIYLARSNYVESLSSVTPANKNSLISRYNEESNYAKIISALSK